MRKWLSIGLVIVMSLSLVIGILVSAVASAKEKGAADTVTAYVKALPNLKKTAVTAGYWVPDKQASVKTQLDAIPKGTKISMKLVGKFKTTGQDGGPPTITGTYKVDLQYKKQKQNLGQKTITFTLEKKGNPKKFPWLISNCDLDLGLLQVGTPTPTATASTPALTPAVTPTSMPELTQTPTISPTATPTLSATPQPSTDLSYLASNDPAEVDNSNLPVTPINQLHVTGTAPQVSIMNYRLTIDGLVNNPLTLTYNDVITYPSVSEVVLLICPLTFVDNAQWTGVPVSTLLSEAGIKAGAAKVAFQALDGYKEVLPLEDVQKDGVFLAYKVDGQVLPLEHGYPLRLVVKGKYGANWVKWVTHIEVM